MKTLQVPVRQTLYIPNKHIDDIFEAQASLAIIDCNFSRLICCLAKNIIKIVVVICKIGKNYRHFNWEIVIQDRETGQWYDRRSAITITKSKKKEQK